MDRVTIKSTPSVGVNQHFKDIKGEILEGHVLMFENQGSLLEKVRDAKRKIKSTRAARRSEISRKRSRANRRSLSEDSTSSSSESLYDKRNRDSDIRGIKEDISSIKVSIARMESTVSKVFTMLNSFMEVEPVEFSSYNPAYEVPETVYEVPAIAPKMESNIDEGITDGFDTPNFPIATADDLSHLEACLADTNFKSFLVN